MIVEYIRYKIDPSRYREFEKAYQRAGALLDASQHCRRWEAARSVEQPEKQIIRIEWDSDEGNLQAFRQSPDFKPFLEATGPFRNDIEEVTHYEVTASAPDQLIRRHSRSPQLVPTANLPSTAGSALAGKYDRPASDWDRLRETLRSNPWRDRLHNEELPDPAARLLRAAASSVAL